MFWSYCHETLYYITIFALVLKKRPIRTVSNKYSILIGTILESEHNNRTRKFYDRKARTFRFNYSYCGNKNLYFANNFY